jgi:hypothetical protein
MGFSLPFGKKRKMRKLMENYHKDRVMKKKAFNEQLERLNAQRNDRRIDQQTYERYRVILEKQYCETQKQEWATVENKFQNSFNQ